jgi:hypothetical protein
MLRTQQKRRRGFPQRFGRQCRIRRQSDIFLSAQKWLDGQAENFKMSSTDSLTIYMVGYLSSNNTICYVLGIIQGVENVILHICNDFLVDQDLGSYFIYFKIQDIEISRIVQTRYTNFNLTWH